MKGGELLLEIGTEEIPSSVLPKAMSDLKEQATRMLLEARIPAERVEAFVTPRRLVVWATGIPPRQATQITEVSGPPRSAAYDAEGRPTAAATGFAKAQGIPVEGLTIKKTDKGDYVCAVRKHPSVAAIRILKDLLPLLVSSLRFQKMMKWNGHGMRFVRPIRWIVAMLDGRVVPFHLAGLSSGNLSRGHRFLSGRPFSVKGWMDYRMKLRRNHVVLDPAEREGLIRNGLARFAKEVRGLVPDDADLLNQAVFLTEQPVVLMGGFDKKYLDLPVEVPVTVMKEHQGYFPLMGKSGSLLPHFLFVSNIKTQKPALIRAGNERVIRARLEDARFYFEQDKKQTLNERVGQLSGLVFHEKLGTLYQKMERIKQLAPMLLREAGRDEQEISRLEKAALLCKSDLLTGMVREFPSLQGIIGREYAKLQEHDSEVADAIAEHYFPRHGDDPSPPRTLTGKFLTAADRLDTLVGFFGVDLMPSGSMDPYALRRQGLGLVQVLLDEAFSRLSLQKAIQTAAGLYADRGVSLKKDSKTIRDELDRFLAQRMETYFKRRFGPETGYRADLADAVLCGAFDNPLDLYLRFVALMNFKRQPDFEPLIVTFKRASRILPAGFKGEVRPDAFKETVEKELYQRCRKAETDATGFFSRRQYPEVLKALADLRQPIDSFFNGVMVMDEDRAVRENRLSLLQRITKLFMKFGDFTKVMVEESSKAR
ncbi:MAG: glycine--tRNA ligase subunit beta [Nitrospirae bacterium]|nr:glycine--tRNA ligase subunit beta [Nitrospirota bacterium]